jgi:drug/metabolite transporter (DMT)-like permease
MSTTVSPPAAGPAVAADPAAEARSTAARRRGTLELVVAMALSGTIGVFVVESGQSPFTVVFFRCLFGALALGAYCLVRGWFTDTGFTPGRLALAAFGGVCIVFNWVFLFASYTMTSITVATVVYHTQPFVVVALGAVVFGERVRDKVGWVLLAFAGVVLTTQMWTAIGGGGTRYWLGVLSALAAAVLYGVATIVAKRLTTVRPHLIALVQVLVGIPLLLPFAAFGDLGGLGAGWLWLAGLGLIHTGVLYALLYASYQKLPTPAIAVLSFIYPVVAMVVDRFVYGTRISLVQLLGVALILLGGLGVNYSRGRRGRTDTQGVSR